MAYIKTLLTLTALLAALMTGANAATQSNYHAERESQCGVPDGWNRDPSMPTDELKPEIENWSSRGSTPLSLYSLSELVTIEPASYLAVVAHETEQVIYVVVDPAAYQALDPGSISAIKDRGGAAEVVVVPSCASREELDSIHQRVIADHGVLAGVAETLHGFGYGYDFVRGRAHFYFPVGMSQEIVDRLKAEHHDRISFSFGELLGRQDDASPHYGGAGLDYTSTQVFPNNCTAGFAVDKGGGRWMVTADHCGEHFGYANPRYWSGGIHYGYSKSAFFNTALPAFNQAGGTASKVGDVAMIGDGTHQYSRVIHVDPCCPSTRTVTAKGTPSTSMSNLCISGSNTLAVCGLKVTNTLTWTPIDPTTGWQMPQYAFTAWRAERVGVQIARAGDSGAPMYIRTGTANATIIGMLFRGDTQLPIVPPGSPTRYDSVIFTARAMIESQLGVAVSTGCCNKDSW